MRLDTLYLEAIKDDTMYKSTVEPLNSIKMLVLIAVAAIAIGCFIVLCNRVYHVDPEQTA